MTPKQAQLLEFIRCYQAKQGFCPSYDEMAAHMQVGSKSNIHRLVNGLEERGNIRRFRNRSRAIEVIEAPSRHLLASKLARVAKARFLAVVDECRDFRPGELEAALLAVLP